MTMDIPLKATKLINIITHFFTTIFTWNNIFTQITFTLLLPLTLIFAAHNFFPTILKNPHHIFTFSFTLSAVDVITSTILLFCHHLWTFFPIPSHNNINIINNNNNNTDTLILLDLNPTKLALTLVLRLILTFILAYFLTLFSYNLTAAILSLTDTIVFTIFVVWYVISNTYLLGTLCLLFVWQLSTMTESEGLVEAGEAAEALFSKVLGAYLLNVLVMSPLTSNVGEEVMASVWDVMIRGIIGVLLLPTFVSQMLLLKRLFTHQLR